MNKKNNKLRQKEWIAHCWAVSLAQQCHDRNKQTKNSSNGSYDGAIKQETISSVLADKTALFYYRLSFIGYLETIFALFKATFCHKKRKGHAKFLGCFIEEINLEDTSSLTISESGQ